jgi:hypothetical protein
MVLKIAVSLLSGQPQAKQATNKYKSPVQIQAVLFFVMV